MTIRQTYAALRTAGMLTGSIKSCMALRESRDAAGLVASPVCHGRIASLAAAGRTRRSRQTIVPLGDAGADVLVRWQRTNSRLREWSLGATASTGPTSLRESGSNSCWTKKSTFRRGIFVQSVATCTDFRVAVLMFDGARHEIAAPRGWRWDLDVNGLRLRSCSDSRIDYHPTASELLAGGPEVARLARAGAETRRKAAAAAKADAAAVKRAEAIGVMVCLADSIRAGNCRAGSENFARNHGLDTRRHYTPAEVLVLANGSTRQVALACSQALRRTIRELAQGYSTLAEHRVS